jgi:hypothetical protein
VSFASRAASRPWREADFPPKPPPTKGAITRTSSGRRESACAIWFLSEKGVWVEAHTVTRPSSSRAVAECVSIVAWAT